MELSAGDLFRYAQVGEEAARRAGREIVYEAVRESGFTDLANLKTKATYADLVTQIDENSEKFIVEYCRQKLGDHVKFIGEESVDASGKVVLTDAPTFIIDPIDGTTNFVHGFPAFVVSVALAVGRKTVAGVIYDISRDDCYTAVLGNGAFLNHQRRLRVSSCKKLKESLIATAIGSCRDSDVLDTVFANCRAVTEQSHGLRTTGSAAYNMITVASGRAEAYFESGIHVWDVAAGMLIVTEAGGVVRDINKELEFNMMSRRVLACCNDDIADALQAVVKPIMTFAPDDDAE